MNLELMTNYLSHLSGFLNLDFTLYENDVLINSFAANGDPFDLKAQLIEKMKDKGLFALNSSSEVTLAKVHVENTPYTIYIGPCLSVPKNNHTTQNILNEFGLPSTVYRDLDIYTSSLPSFKFYSILSLAISTYEAINHIYPNLNDNFSLNLSNTVNMKTLPTSSNRNTVGFSQRERSYRFEEKLKFLVANGITEELSTIGQFADLAPTASQIATGTLRQIQNCVEVLITICSRAAMSGGLPPIIAYDLSDVYYLKTENVQTVEELYSMSANIPLVFATKVREFIEFNTNNYIVRKCISFIYENLFNKITLEDIAEAIGSSPTYVSAQFSKEYNMTIPSFIKRCRIRYSKYLLKFSEYSLVEIANTLNFSSQSAFQNAFKDIVGMTPMEYKNSTEI